jgi:short-subunit dehydrogenase
MPERLLAVVTGASSGMGAMFARKLAARGYDLLLAARREDRLRKLAAELTSDYGVAVELLVVDLATDEGREALAGRIRTAPNFGLLVNNAGFGTMGMFQQADLEPAEQMHRLHVLATLALSHAALRTLAARPDHAGKTSVIAGKTGIINVSSVAAFGQSPTSICYNATKAWMNSFTEGLAIELAAQGSAIKVQALCPGFTYSEFHDRVGMDRGRIPKALWMSTDFVVGESLRGFDRGALFVIPGWRYRLLVAFMKATPSWIMRRITIFAAGRFRRAKTSS